MPLPSPPRTRGTSYRRLGGAWDVPPLDALLSAVPPRADAVVDGPARLSSLAVNRAAAAAAAGLRARGVRRRHVVTWTVTGPPWHSLVLLRACWRIGAVAAPRARHRSPDDLGLPPGVPVHHLEPGEIDAVLDADPAAAGPRAARPADPALLVPGDEPRSMLVHSHRGLAAAAGGLAARSGLRRKDVLLCLDPLSSVEGVLGAALVPTLAGCSSVLLPVAEPAAARRLLAVAEANVLRGAGTALRAVLASTPARQRPDRVRTVQCGSHAGPLTRDEVRELSDGFDARLVRWFGCAAAPAITATAPGAGRKEARRDDGPPLPDTEVRVDLATGEVLARTPTAAAVLAGTPAERGGWVRTGVRGEVGRHGRLELACP